MRNVQIRLRRPLDDVPSPEDFELLETDAPALRNGSILFRACWLAPGPVAALRPGEIVPARGVGEVIESRHDVFAVGDSVTFECGLQVLCASDGVDVRRVHPGQNPVSLALGILGTPGMTAYFGLLEVARLRPGETVLVCGADSTEGTMAGQIAIIRGARAVGITGSRERCEWLTRTARFSACVGLDTDDAGHRLADLLPRGVDVCFVAEGGRLPLAARGLLRERARVVLSGEAARQADELAAAAPGAEILAVQAGDFHHRREQFLRDAIAWYGEERLVYREEVVQGLAAAPALLCRLARGEIFGEPLVAV